MGEEKRMKNQRLVAAAILLTIVFTLTLVFAQLTPTTSDWLVHITAEAQYKDICVHEAYAIITYKTYLYPNLTILDVRTPDEYNGVTSPGHIAGAINIPWDQLKDYFDNGTCPLIGSEDNVTIVYCRAGVRSARACDILVDEGFSPIYNMLGGITAWTNPAWNYPVVVGPPPTPIIISVLEAYEMVTNGSCNIIVDVRSRGAYDLEHIVNSTVPTILHARNIPYISAADFATKIDQELPGHENNPIIVYCQNSGCGLAQVACQVFVNNALRNFTRVYEMYDGIDVWKNPYDYPTAPTPPPPPEAFSDGFESGTFSAWTGTSLSSGETLQVVGTQFYEGLYSCHAKCVTAKHRAYAYYTFSSANDTCYMRFYVRFAADLVNGGSGMMLMHMASSTNKVVFNLRIRKTGGLYELSVGNYPEGTYYNSASFSISLDTWYVVELQVHVDASAGWFKALWEGVAKVDESGKNTGTTMIQRVNVGIAWNWDTNVEIYVDSVVVSNDPIP